MTDPVSKLDITSVLIGGGIAAFSSLLVGVGLDCWKRWRDGSREKHLRREELTAALKLVLFELRVAQESEPLSTGRKDGETWRPMPASGLELPKRKDLLNELASEMRETLLRAYSYLHQVNFCISMLGQRLDVSKDHAWFGVDPIRKPCI